MPLDHELNARMRTALAAHAGITEKKMMGGLCFFRDGHMLCGARRHKDGVGRFMFRVGKDRQAEALEDKSARQVVLGTRKLGGFVHVDAEACDSTALTRWLELCLDHVTSLPPRT